MRDGIAPWIHCLRPHLVRVVEVRNDNLEMGMEPFRFCLRRNFDGSMAGIFPFSTNLLEKSQRRLAGI